MTNALAPSEQRVLKDRVICACFEVRESEIRAFLENPEATFDEFVLTTGATTKCTACSIDFDLIVESIRTGMVQKRRALHQARLIQGSSICDVVDSGFIINKDGIETVVRIDNRPNAFDASSRKCLASYNWHMRIFNETGQLYDKFGGHLDVDKSLTVELKKRNCPDLGWFWLWLEPKSAGYFGSTRPQLALLGADWVATVHTQPHASACYRKAVMIQAQAGGFRTLVSIVNGARRRVASCELTLSSVVTGEQEKQAVTIAANGSKLIAIDEVFPGAASRMQEASLVVSSDQAVRKHIIKIQPSGCYSIDHFPDAK